MKRSNEGSWYIDSTSTIHNELNSKTLRDIKRGNHNFWIYKCIQYTLIRIIVVIYTNNKNKACNFYIISIIYIYYYIK